jgi:hypothetical protein
VRVEWQPLHSEGGHQIEQSIVFETARTPRPTIVGGTDRGCQRRSDLVLLVGGGSPSGWGSSPRTRWALVILGCRSLLGGHEGLLATVCSNYAVADDGTAAFSGENARIASFSLLIEKDPSAFRERCVVIHDC